MPFVEDEWHVLLVCPLYAPYRMGLPFTTADVLVEGHPMQGAGCTPRNLSSLARAILSMQNPNYLEEFLMRAMAARRRDRISYR